MKPVLFFGTGALTVFGIESLVALLVVAIGAEHASRSRLLIGMALILFMPFVGAAVSATAYFLGLKVFRKSPSLRSSYFLGLASALFVMAIYWLLSSQRVIHFAWGLYGNYVWPPVLCVSGFLASLFTARRVG